MPINQEIVRTVVRAEQDYEQSLIKPKAATNVKRVELF